MEHQLWCEFSINMIKSGNSVQFVVAMLKSLPRYFDLKLSTIFIRYLLFEHFATL